MLSRYTASQSVYPSGSTTLRRAESPVAGWGWTALLAEGKGVRDISSEDREGGYAAGCPNETSSARCLTRGGHRPPRPRGGSYRGASAGALGVVGVLALK
jgi:hypothetical protein